MWPERYRKTRPRSEGHFHCLRTAICLLIENEAVGSGISKVQTLPIFAPQRCGCSFGERESVHCFLPNVVEPDVIVRRCVPHRDRQFTAIWRKSWKIILLRLQRQWSYRSVERHFDDFKVLIESTGEIHEVAALRHGEIKRSTPEIAIDPVDDLHQRLDRKHNVHREWSCQERSIAANHH